MNGIGEIKPLYIARSIETEKVVRAYLHPGSSGVAHIVDKLPVLECASFRGFDYHEFYPTFPYFFEVDITVMRTDVYTHYLMILESCHRMLRILSASASGKKHGCQYCWQQMSRYVSCHNDFRVKHVPLYMNSISPMP